MKNQKPNIIELHYQFVLQTHNPVAYGSMKLVYFNTITFVYIYHKYYKIDKYNA